MAEFPQSVQEHLEGRGSVCPYASAPAIRRRLPALDDPSCQRVVQSTLETLQSSGKKALLLAPGEPLSNHREVDLYSKQIYKKLFCAAFFLGGPSVQTDWLMDYEDNLKTEVTFPSALVLLPPEDIWMFTFFSPHFDSRHPRYLPEPVGVLVAHREFERVEALVPGISIQIGMTAIARVIHSMLDPKFDLSPVALADELPYWRAVFGDMEPIFDDREDPTFPNLDLRALRHKIGLRTAALDPRGNFSPLKEAVFRDRLGQISGLPLLRKILAAHPDLRIMDLAHAVFTHHAGLYPKPVRQFKSAK